MTKIVIILNEDGTFETALSDSELNLQVLKRGQDDDKIDIAESNLDIVE